MRLPSLFFWLAVVIRIPITSHKGEEYCSGIIEVDIAEPCLDIQSTRWIRRFQWIMLFLSQPAGKDFVSLIKEISKYLIKILVGLDIPDYITDDLRPREVQDIIKR